MCAVGFTEYPRSGCPSNGATSFVQNAMLLYVAFIYFWLQINRYFFLGLSPLLKQSLSITVRTSLQATGGTVGCRPVRTAC